MRFREKYHKGKTTAPQEKASSKVRKAVRREIPILKKLAQHSAQLRSVGSDALCGLAELRSLNVTGCSNLALQEAIDRNYKLEVVGGAQLRRIASPTAAALIAAVNRRRSRKCAYCATTVGLEEPPFRVCAACGRTAYCSRDHQKLHWEWPNENYCHRRVCSAIRRRRRRQCDVCGRVGSLEEPPFPVCDGCGGRRYCGAACQLTDWEAGHAQVCVVAAASSEQA